MPFVYGHMLHCHRAQSVVTIVAMHRTSPIPIPYQGSPQLAFLTCPVREIFFGGSRGGSKTWSVLFRAKEHVIRYGANALVLIVRRRFVDMRDLIRESAKFFAPIGGRYNRGTNVWEFPSGHAAGAIIVFSHIWSVDDVQKYQGWNITLCCFEEITNWPTPEPFLLMYAALRSGAGVPTTIVATGNPGGPGHGWVKSRWIDPDPLGYRIISETIVLPGGQSAQSERMFIPSRLEDNPALYLGGGSEYELGLHRLGSEMMVKAWRFGIWDIVAGGFFDDIWTPDRHLVDPFKLPAHWRRARSFDWGFSSPASLGLYVIADGVEIETNCGEMWFPRGSMIRIGTSYYASKDSTGKWTGAKKTNVELARAVAEDTVRVFGKSPNWLFSIADPSIWASKGSASIYQEMSAEGLVSFTRAQNARVEGWLKMIDMLSEARKDRPERPGLWVFSTDEHFVRTVPTLQRDLRDPDDVDTTGEDHVADDCRYACLEITRTPGVTRLTGY